MAMNELRGATTLDGLFSQIHNLLDTAQRNHRDLDVLADQVCGGVPETAQEASMDRPANGRIDQLANLLEMICIHQDNSRASIRRLERTLAEQTGKSALADAVGDGSAFTKQVRY